MTFLLFITTAINIVVAYISWQRRKAKGGLYFSLGIMAVTMGLLGTGFNDAATTKSLHTIFLTVEAGGYLSGLALFMMFAISFAGQDAWLQKKWGKVLFPFALLVNILVVSTNHLNGWPGNGFQETLGIGLTVEHGPVYLWVQITNNLMALTILLNLWQTSRDGSEISGQQGRFLLLAFLVPLAVNMAYQLEVIRMDGVTWASITFLVTGLLCFWCLTRQRLLELSPVPRNALIENIKDGLIVLDSQSRIVDINPAAVEIFETASENMIGKALAEISPHTHHFLEQEPEKVSKNDLEIGAQDKRCFEVVISPLREGAGKLIGRFIVYRDITDRKVNELLFLQFSQAVEQSPASVVITNLKGIIEYVNPQFSLLTGFTYEEVIGKRTSILKSGQTPNEVYQDMWKTIFAGHPWRGEFLNKKKNGDLYWEQAVMAPVLDSEGEILNFIAVKEDITARKEAEANLRNANTQLEAQLKEIEQLQHTLREQAVRDALTGLHNRHYLNETLSHELARAKRSGYFICFAMIDIDRFKSINDKYGHATGDKVLIDLANQLLKYSRTGDIVCRYGGEEFLIVLPNTGVEAAAQIAERWRATIQESKIVENDADIKISISCGISEFPTNASTEAEALEKADKALYAAKYNGRNQVVLWSKIEK